MMENQRMSFVAEAKRRFDPIAQQFGMVCVVSSDLVLRYENACAFLTIIQDSRGSGELGVEIGSTKRLMQGPPYSLADILHLNGAQDAAWISGLMVADQSVLPGALSRLADLTVKYAADLLSGREFSLARLESFRNKEGARFELERKLRLARSTVETAWRARDHEAVVRAFEPVEAHLSEAERKKLQYSRSHRVRT